MESYRRPRIAYYTINDPLDKRSWSGLTYFIGQILQKNIGEVHFLGPVRIPWILDKTFRAIQKFTRFVFKTEYIPKYSLLKNVYASLVLKKKMKGRQYDFLFAPAAASELAYLKTNLPIIYFGDATYKLYSETYEKEFKNLNSFSRREGEHLERRALKKSDLIIFSSHWAARSAISDYGVPPGKIEIIQMGANIDNVPEREMIFRKEENKVLTLLFLSVDWERKGGAIAFDALKYLDESGMDVKLIVCGCIPPPEYVHSKMEVIPFLNKNKAEDFQQFVNLLSYVHFLLLPTRADCTPLVNCESNAYGVPAITTNVGGISEAVKDGVNGYCLEMEAGGPVYAKLIREVFLDKQRYHQLIESSRKRFEEELNWDKFSAEFHKALRKHKLVKGEGER
jgi:glycosyltransferase involved in cell wall biosynthesis